ncbi:MAG: NAD(P)H-dependent glycerol-3-phosphate dehydrogenase [bacterium]|nr:NAD(P)H-dependent glycerol-3-phosphate dehydrogenase [bacterium]
MKVGVIGAGAFGTALAVQLIKNKNEVLLWSFEDKVVEEINQLHQNNTYLAGVLLLRKLKASQDLKKVINWAEIVFNTTPVFATRSTYKGINLKGKVLVSASKGIEKETHQLLHEIFGQTLEGAFQYAALSGPSFARELAVGEMTAVSLASKEPKVSENVKKLLESSNFRVQIVDDVVGVELGGALKNVLAIAAGICAGAGRGKDFQAAIFVEGLNEMIALGEKMGAEKQTFYSLAGLGDLFLTSTSDQSRNFNFGFQLGQGDSVQKALAGKTVEGVGSAESAAYLAEKHSIKAPLFENIYAVTSGKKEAKKALVDIWSALEF